MNADWQSLAAAAVVLVTAAVFVMRMVRARKVKSGCCGGCDCKAKNKRRD